MNNSDLHICTRCGKPSDQLRTRHVKNVNGKMVDLLKPDDRVCPACCAALSLPNLKVIHNERLNKLKLNSHA